MTHTTTDAAEARAREVLARAMASKHWGGLVREGKDGNWHVIKPSEAIAAMRAFATAEAASGAGEREGLAYMQGQLDMRERAAKVCDQRGGEEQEAFGLNRATQNYFRARNAVRGLEPVALASLPPATDPAMVTLPRAKLEHWQRVICGDWCKPGNHCSDCRDFAAALAAAPTIPATGETKNDLA